MARRWACNSVDVEISATNGEVVGSIPTLPAKKEKKMAKIKVDLEKTNHFFIQLWINEGPDVNDGCGQPQTDTIVFLSLNEAEKLIKDLNDCLSPLR